MTMQDLQNVFWEGRTRGERIASDRSRAAAYLEEAAFRNELHSHCSAPQPVPLCGVFFRFCAYPHSSLELDDLDSRSMWVKLLRPEGRWLFERHPLYPSGDGLVNWSPRPIAHGVEIVDTSPCRWVIRDNGAFELFGFCEAVVSPKIRDARLINPSWVLAPVAQMLTMVEAVRRRARRPGIPFELDAEIRPVNAWAHSRVDDWEQEVNPLSHRPWAVGPFIYRREAAFEEVFRSIEREIWHAMGLAHIKPIPITPERAVNQLLQILSEH